MKTLLLCSAVCAMPLEAQTVRVVTSQVSIEDPSQPGAWVDVLFENRNTNGPRDNVGVRDLGDGIRFVFTFTPGDDTVEVIPPEGFFCLPSCVMTVPEDQSARISLFSKLDMVGM